MVLEAFVEFMDIAGKLFTAWTAGRKAQEAVGAYNKKRKEKLKKKKEEELKEKNEETGGKPDEGEDGKKPEEP